ncbi:GbsR/MarR family transcriptional regulator [Fictibacillus enclensis]|uniref:choline uptake/conversion transcriptional regulator CudC n=1 Tax=Fictibacillus enclensis TaxID=1017270 RepID=UPI0024C0A8B1|nr:GbsR/MarR family transcriptional regulator [Fictibacillus enclensis]MDM5339476.1 GbsR/MarR family transcriptional regulator [Fictibacillus enclensis]WHY70921.1 GbsR/MarR family transcriptional regulator [Fictibacillus enclensis]
MQDHNEMAREAIERAKGNVVHSIAETMDLYGVTPSAGRLYGTMYFENAMTLDEMKEELKMSKPSMSTAVRTLQEINVVHKTWQKGSRKDVFVAEKNFFKSLIHFFCIKWMREVRLNLEAIEMSEKDLQTVIQHTKVDKAIRAEAERHFELIHESKKYYYWLETLVDSFETGDIFRYLPIPDDDKK